MNGVKNFGWMTLSPTPEGFHHRVADTLNGLKEESMKKRHKIGTAVLVAAVILILLIGSAAAGYFSVKLTGWAKVSEDAPQEPRDFDAGPAGAADAMTRFEYEQTILKISQANTGFVGWRRGTGRPSQRHSPPSPR